jgi:S-phase kinase-associated protein 1
MADEPSPVSPIEGDGKRSHVFDSTEQPKQMKKIAEDLCKAMEEKWELTEEVEAGKVFDLVVPEGVTPSQSGLSFSQHSGSYSSFVLCKVATTSDATPITQQPRSWISAETSLCLDSPGYKRLQGNSFGLVHALFFPTPSESKKIVEARSAFNTPEWTEVLQQRPLTIRLSLSPPRSYESIQTDLSGIVSENVWKASLEGIRDLCEMEALKTQVLLGQCTSLPPEMNRIISSYLPEDNLLHPGFWRCCLSLLRHDGYEEGVAEVWDLLSRSLFDGFRYVLGDLSMETPCTFMSILQLHQFVFDASTSKDLQPRLEPLQAKIHGIMQTALTEMAEEAVGQGRAGGGGHAFCLGFRSYRQQALRIQAAMSYLDEFFNKSEDNSSPWQSNEDMANALYSEALGREQEGLQEGLEPDPHEAHPCFCGRRRKAAASTELGVAREFTLTASDGKSFSVPEECARLSGLIGKLLRSAGSLTLLPPIPVPVSSQLLDLVVKFLLHHQKEGMAHIPSPLRHTDMKLNVADLWLVDFIEGVYLSDRGGSKQQLRDLILAANFLCVRSLLHLGCATLASLIKGKPLEQIHDILTIDE